MLYSCSSSEKVKQVNNNKSLWGKYCIGEIYQTLDELFVLEVNDDGKKILALSPAGLRVDEFRNYYSTPLSKDDNTLLKGNMYLAETKVVKIIPAGTELEITEIIQTYTFDWFFGEVTDTTVYGKLKSLDSSMPALDLTNVSYRYPIKDMYYLSEPNTTFLQKKIVCPSLETMNSQSATTE